MKVVTVVGARPQFVKCAGVSVALRGRAEEDLIHTGQHYDHNMSQAFFDELGIPEPKAHLEVGSAPHGKQTAEMLWRLEGELLARKPDVVLVYGDTNSTLAGALAAAKLHIPVAHVEAGLRSFNRRMPEEINRVLTDHISTKLFCPTPTAVENLRREGVEEGVHLVGDVMFDAVMQTLERTRDAEARLKRLGLEPFGYFLATLHRAENTDDKARLAAILSALEELAETHEVVMPLHPRTRARLSGSELNLRRVQVIDPVGYTDMLVLERNALAILTDSGGVQKEALWLEVPCVTLRDETEWVETLESGWNVLAGADPHAIREAALRPRPSTPPATKVAVGLATAAVVRELCA